MNNSDVYDIIIRKMATTRDTDTFSKMDPYIKIIFGNQTQKTSVKENEGKHARYDEAFKFSNIEGQQIKFEVWDEDPGTDDFVCDGIFALSKLNHDSEFKGQIPLVYKQNIVGHLEIEIVKYKQ